MDKRLRDIIHIPEIKLVVELGDAEKDPTGITSSFIVTEDIERNLTLILEKINKAEGSGIFIKGNYGSGKSHFLAYIYLLLKQRQLPFLHAFPKIKQLDLKLLKVSLVKYPASNALEKIILSALGYEGDVLNRDKVFGELLGSHCVVIIDELSEFLSSKPDPQSFFEDVRFLSFLGEYSFSRPFWIIASLQEWIEETGPASGHLSSSFFNRIKDRFPLRINLTTSHIEDLVDRRIVIKLEGADDVIKSQYSEIRKYYPHLQLGYDEFRRTYPLHPFTLRYLTGLTSIFSQRRGVIQFVKEEAQKILDEPVDTLITPEQIYDHFEDRIREIPEYSVFSRVVFTYYKEHIKEILPQPAMQEAGLAAIKILILTEISLLEKRKTAKEIAEILLKRKSTISDDINYQFIQEGVLDPLSSHQMFIKKDGDVYYIDPKVDEGLRVRAKIKAEREKLSDRELLFSRICSMFSMPHFPLKDLTNGRRYNVKWENSYWDCYASLHTKDFFKRPELEKMLSGLEKWLDCSLVLLSPFSQDKHLAYSVKESFSSPFLPLISFWVPREATEEELGILEHFVAKTTLLTEFPNLSADMRREELEFNAVVEKLYLEGEVVTASGRKFDNLQGLGSISLDRFLPYIFEDSFSEVHPKHHEAMPKLPLVLSQSLANLYTFFIKSGKITVEDAEKKRITEYIKGLLEPMGLVKKKGGSYLISVEVENELVSHFLNLTSHDDNFSSVKQALRKGKWGLSNDQIHLLISVFVASGQIVLYRGEEIVELQDLAQLSTGGISKIKSGKTLSPELISYVPRGKFIWGEVEDVPTPPTQKTMWRDATAFVRKCRKLIDDINSFISRYRDYSIFKRITIDNVLMNRLSMFLNSVTLSLAPAEGIERFLLYLRDNPDMAGETEYIEKLHRFFAEQFQHAHKYYLYITHPALKLPADKKYTDIPLGEKRDLLVVHLDEFLASLKGDFESIKAEWDEFYLEFTKAYRQSHESYYQANIFKLRKEIEDSEEARALKRIARAVTSATFSGEWWELKRELDRGLPEPCREDLNNELFLKPFCRCEHAIGDTPPDTTIEFIDLCREGIINFVRLLQSHTHREKLDSYVFSIRDSGKTEIAKKLTSLITLQLEKTTTSMILPLLTDEVLAEIGNAFKGSWKIKDVRVKDFITLIRGRRFRQKELRDLFMRWIGDDEESIIHVRDDNEANALLVKEALCKYGPQGERAFLELEKELHDTDESIETILTGQAILPALESINLRAIATEDLFKILEREQIPHLRKRLRSELFHRSWEKLVPQTSMDSTNDALLKDLLTIVRISSEKGKHRGVDIFTKVIAPMSFLLEKVTYDANAEAIDGEVLSQIKLSLNEIFTEYDRRPDRLAGAKDVAFLKDRLHGVAVVFDGLRYDLWCMLREVMKTEGWRLTEESYVVSPPTTTSNFRNVIGIGEEQKGSIGNKSYVLLKWAERDAGRRELKKILKGSEDIKFLHCNFIDAKMHNSTLDLYPLCLTIKAEFQAGILPILRDLRSFFLLSDHGFIDTKRLKERYAHGDDSVWETVLPFVEVRMG